MVKWVKVENQQFLLYYKFVRLQQHFSATPKINYTYRCFSHGSVTRVRTKRWISGRDKISRVVGGGGGGGEEMCGGRRRRRREEEEGGRGGGGGGRRREEEEGGR